MLKKVSKAVMLVVEWTVILVLSFYGTLGIMNVVRGDTFWEGLSAKELQEDVGGRYQLYKVGNSDTRVKDIIGETKESQYEKATHFRETGTVGLKDRFTFDTYKDTTKEEIEELYSSIDYTLLNEEFGKLINQYRESLGLSSLDYFEEYKEGSEMIAKELADYGFIVPMGQYPHTLPSNNDITLTIFKGIDEEMYYRGLGENLSLIYTYNNPYKLVSEKYLAEEYFDGWLHSEGHRLNMEKGYYKGYSLAIYPVVNGNSMIADKTEDGTYEKYRSTEEYEGFGIVGALTLIQ